MNGTIQLPIEKRDFLSSVWTSFKNFHSMIHSGLCKDFHSNEDNKHEKQKKG